MRKFYKVAESGTAPGGHVVRLDGKTVRTPLSHPQIVPTAALAAEMAREWAAQGDTLVPAAMPLTQLANVMIDKGRGAAREEVEQQVCDYASADLLCYFATHPDDLVRRQESLWRPLLAWMEGECGVSLETVSGIQYHNQPPESLDRILALVGELDAPAFTVVQAATATTGSFVIALALSCGRIDAAAAFQAACVDEIWQLEKWGEDVLARDRLNALRVELEVVARFRELVSTTA